MCRSRYVHCYRQCRVRFEPMPNTFKLACVLTALCTSTSGCASLFHCLCGGPYGPGPACCDVGCGDCCEPTCGCGPSCACEPTCACGPACGPPCGPGGGGFCGFGLIGPGSLLEAICCSCCGYQGWYYGSHGYGPGCGCEPACGCEPSCYCEPSCTCEPACACEPGCYCEPSCVCEPACSCEPSCVCEPACACPPSCGYYDVGYSMAPQAEAYPIASRRSPAAPPMATRRGAPSQRTMRR
jgi:hypothetical protein